MDSEGLVIGRYVLHDELASGGMASVHLGRLIGSVGFSRAVAIKRMHSFLARDPEFVAMFLDEARMASRIRHQNVVPTLDVVASDGELFLVMEYVLGESLSRVLAANKSCGARAPLDVTSAIIIGLLEGLHAAHEAKDERGDALHIVHRDVSPQNVLIGADGVARVFDFGVAKAAGRIQTTHDGSVRGKLSYMSPEQLSNGDVDRRSDVWASGVVLWELLADKRLYMGDSVPALVQLVLTQAVPPPTSIRDCPTSLDAVVAKALAPEASARFASAREMALALESAVPPASPRTVADWLAGIAGTAIRAREVRIEEMDRSARIHRPSRGTVRTRLAALGLARDQYTPVGSPARDEEVTGGAPGRVLQRTEVEAPSVSPPPSPSPSPSPRGRRWRLATRALLVLGVCVAVWFVSRTLGRCGASPSAGPEASSPPQAMPAPPLPASGEPPRAAPLASAPAPVASAVETRAPPSSEAPAATTRRPPRRAPSPVLSASRPTGAASDTRCDPPYTIGPAPDFIKKPKLECLPP